MLAAGQGAKTAGFRAISCRCLTPETHGFQPVVPQMCHNWLTDRFSRRIDSGALKRGEEDTSRVAKGHRAATPSALDASRRRADAWQSVRRRACEPANAVHGLLYVPVMSWSLEVGTVTTRAEVASLFGGATQGGIQPSARSDNVMVYSDPSSGAEHGYKFDGWASDGAFYYTGEGQIGDQQLTKGNKAIADHVSQARGLRVFEAVTGKRASGAVAQRYIGEFRVDPSAPHRREEASDREGLLRSVLVFKLLPVSGDVLDGSEVTADAPVASSVAELVAPESNEVRRFDRMATDAGVSERKEATMMADLEAELGSMGLHVCRVRITPPGSAARMYTDTFDVSRGELFELKAAATRVNVRTAIGQLLDYRRFVSGVSTSTVGLPTCPAADLVELIHDCGMQLVVKEQGVFVRVLAGDARAPL